MTMDALKKEINAEYRERVSRGTWHKVCGIDILVADGKILYGTGTDQNGSPITVYPYRSCRRGGMELDQSMTVAAFRAAYRRGTATMR